MPSLKLGIEILQKLHLRSGLNRYETLEVLYSHVRECEDALHEALKEEPSRRVRA